MQKPEIRFYIGQVLFVWPFFVWPFMYFNPNWGGDNFILMGPLGILSMLWGIGLSFRAGRARGWRHWTTYVAIAEILVLVGLYGLFNFWMNSFR